MNQRTPDMVGIPPALDTDAEDVVWALQTAEALWKRNERVDAIVWLRRAAQAAGEAENDDRALALARGAAELSEWLAQNAQGAQKVSGAPAAAPPAPPPPPTPRSPVAPAPFVPPARDSIPTATSEAAIEDLLKQSESPDPLDITKTGEASTPPPARPVSRGAPNAAEVHAGMFDPWAEESETGRIVPPDDVVPKDVPASVATPAPAPRRAMPPPPPPPASTPPARKAPPPLPPPRAPAPRPAPSPPPPPAPKPSNGTLAREVPPPREDSPAVAALEIPEVPVEEVLDDDVVVAEEATPVPPASAPSAPAPSVKPEPPPEPPKEEASRPPLDLSTVEAFADLPDDARDAFAAAATLTTLAPNEEVQGFALALVVQGAVEVAATIVDAPVERLEAGAVVRARGTLEHVVPVRLMAAAEETVVATWDDAAVNSAFRTCPWVEDDLRSAADRLQALVGVTFGPLGDRFDASLRAQVTSALQVKTLPEGEVFVQQGAAVPGLLLVAAGELELVRDNSAYGAVTQGDFLFPSSILSASPAPATARAGKGGALVLVADRRTAQELLVTYPPLLELFAGM